MNPVIAQIDAGHVATLGVAAKGEQVKPTVCRSCGVRWPCPPIMSARQQVRVMEGRLRQGKALRKVQA